MYKTNTPNLELIKSLVYLQDDGTLFWKHRLPEFFSNCKNPCKECSRWNTRYAGTKALNTLSKNGYLVGQVSGIALPAHRVVWALYYGSWPTGFIDHINGVRTDNRICNLRDVSYVENNKNAKFRKDNKSGHSCIRLRASGKYEVNVRFKGKQNCIGQFSELEDAIRARDDVHKSHNYSERHGK